LSRSVRCHVASARRNRPSGVVCRRVAVQLIRSRFRRGCGIARGELSHAQKPSTRDTFFRTIAATHRWRQIRVFASVMQICVEVRRVYQRWARHRDGERRTVAAAVMAISSDAFTNIADASIQQRRADKTVLQTTVAKKSNSASHPCRHALKATLSGRRGYPEEERGKTCV